MSATEVAPGGGPVRVVVLELSRAGRALTVQRLSDASDITVVEATGEVPAAMAALRRGAPDALLADHGVLGGDDGVEVVRRIREVAPGICVLLHSALPQDGLESERRRLAADLVVPMGDGQALLDALRGLSGGRAAAGGPDASRPADVAAGPEERAWTAPATPEQVTSLRHAVAGFLDAHGGLDARRRDDVLLVVSELLTNVIRHAYRGRPPRDVEVELAIAGEVRVAVRDRGVGMSPNPDAGGLGLGLAVVGRLSDGFEVRTPPGGGTEVRVVLRGGY